MQEKKRNKSFYPYWVVAFIFCYIGAFGITQVYGNLDHGDILGTIILFVVFSFVFSYGVICLIIDFKRGGIHSIIDKIKHLRDGEI